jgi:ABC-type nitrate/sulfonate/bicarbonate transport system substrate-binding protein
MFCQLKGSRMLAFLPARHAWSMLLFCMAGVMSAAARGADMISIGLVSGSPALYWPVEIGRAKGMFAAEGLTIDAMYVPSSGGIVQQLSAGSLNMGVAGLVDPIRAVEKGAPIALIRIEGAVPPYSLIAKPEIKRIEDLKGKTISLGGSADITRIYVERMLAPHGVMPAQFDMVFAGSTTARFAALQSGAVDATILGAPFDNRAEAAGFSNLGLTMEYVKDLPFSGYAVNRAWASGNLATVRSFLVAYQKSVDWFYDDQNRDEAIRLVVDLSHGDRADVARSYEFFRRIEFFEKNGRISPNGMQSLVGVLKKIGVLDREMEPDALVMHGITR